MSETEIIPKHRKKRKPGTYAIQYRGVGFASNVISDWRIWKKYRNREDRNKALAMLRCKPGCLEFRARPA